ncbi:MAG: glycosyl hydrolase family 17 protein [Candidatus Omnitrophica bacterium]|nr:glycosyl hydrolase family 17 protein [Candidatus Omnitrophota bacterium]MCM8804398.1 glycosyl hydrolase family 17 protein [Candidatus Omnitrophota bacterium]
MKTLGKFFTLYKGALGIVLLGIALTFPIQDGESKIDKNSAILKKYYGFCYGPFRKNEDPDKGVLPTEEEIKEDISFLVKFTGKIRTYGNTGTLSKIPALSQEVGLECYVGAWISKYKIENEKEIDNLIKIANSNLKNIKGLIVGNEVLLRKDLSEEELSNYIKKVKDATKIDVGTAETWSVLLNNTNIVKNTDFLLVHIHPYWEGVSIKEAPEYVIKRYEEIKAKFPDKKIIIGETGWPTAGEIIGKAVPSPENQKIFFERFTKLAEENKIPYFYFEVFDEEWKNKFEGETGAHWGIFNSDGSLKFMFYELFPQEIRKGINRPARQINKVPIKAPVMVYDEAGSEENHFEPTGWMGDLESLNIERDCKEFPHSGKTCIKIIYSPTTFDSWAGIYWQYPINNWGEYPGYTISGASKLTFWARGEKGNEKAEFKVGGINKSPYHNPKFPYQDSFGPLTTGIVNLTKDWKKYSIDLKKENLSNVIGGFCWVTNRSQNPKGCIIYVDDIKFE